MTVGKWVNSVEDTLARPAASALQHRPSSCTINEWNQHFLTRCGDHERRRLLARYSSHLIINILKWSDNMTVQHYLDSHVHVVQLQDLYPENPKQKKNTLQSNNNMIQPTWWNTCQLNFIQTLTSI